MAVEIGGQRPVSSWIELVKDTGSAFHNKLSQIYSNNDDLKTEAAQMCLRALQAFAKAYGADRSVSIVRSIGRVNLVGW
jgi:hypothetical protein